MELDHRFRPGNGANNSRIIFLGDSTGSSSHDHDGEMFDHDDEEKDLDSQVDKYPADNKANATEVTTTESPSSTKTEESDAAPSHGSPKDSRLPDKAVTEEKSA